MNPVAQLQGICKVYGSGHATVTALRDIDLALYPGELTLIEGPSGCGKTTLLEILGLLLPPNKGQVLIHDRRASGLGQARTTRLRRRHVAFVFQDFNLLESLAAHDNIEIVAALHGPHPARRTREALATLGLQNRARHRPSQLSGGEKQRVAIGRALVSGATLLLADEPTANLDWSIGKSIVQTLSDIARSQNRCVVVVSHDPRLEPFADRVISLLDGTIAGQRRAGRAAAVMIALLVVLATAVAGWDMAFNSDKAGDPPLPLSPPALRADDVIAAAPAVTEPCTKTIQLSCDRPGIIVAIFFASGEQVVKGEALVQLDDTEAKAQCELCQAQLDSAKAALADLRAWTRPEDIDQARAQVEADKARLAYAEYEYQRLLNLRTTGASAANEVEKDLQDLNAYKAQVKADQAMLDKDLNGPTPTALAQARARVAEADAALALAREALGRRCLCSPVNGKVLYVYKRPGEAIDLESPSPILSLAESGPMHLRADVDEADIGRIFVGQKVLATSESLDKTYAGTVISMEPMMGRRNILTNRPRERQDTRIREVVIQMQDDAGQLPIDLMMTVRFLRTVVATKELAAPASQPAAATTEPAAPVSSSRSNDADQ